MVLAACKCMRLIGHLDNLRECWPRFYSPSPEYLSLGDWTKNPHIWLHYVESADDIAKHDVLETVDTQYWSIHDVQRYFRGDLHCEQVLYTYQYPTLRMPTRLGSYFWKANTSLKLPSQVYLKDLHISVNATLQKMLAKRVQMDRIIVCDQLVKINQMDMFRRQTFFKCLLNILSSQDHLQLVSLENLCCKRLEGVRLIQQLACFNADTLKYLFLWRFVLPNKNPLLINYSYITGCGQYIPRLETRHCFLRSLSELRNLKVLALEYSHVADGSGDAILSLLPVLKRPHFRLQMMCREDQVPGKVDASLGAGGYGIPDTAWKFIAFTCPDIYILIAFFRVRDYDNVRRFLTPSIPLRETHLELGIDLCQQQRQDSDLSCFIRHIAHQYGNTLVTISIHQWRFAIFPLRRVFELMPTLVRLRYVGAVQDEVDLWRMMRIVACGVCNKLKEIKIQIQDEESKRDYWQKVVENLMEEFKDIMKLYDISFCLNVYKN